MPCTDKNPLQREGTSQQNRVLAALGVHYADVDERMAADLILFAKRYAAYLNFYNDQNVREGDWQPLMAMDISVTLATLSSIHVQRIGDYKKLLYKNISLSGNLSSPAKEAKAKQQLKFLLDALFSLVTIIDEQLGLLPDDDYKTIISGAIASKLSAPLANLQERFFTLFLSQNLLDYSIDEKDSLAPLAVKSDAGFTRASLSSVWQTASPQLTITIPAALPDYEKIVYVINHNLFNNTVDALIKGVAGVVGRSKELFDKTMVDFPKHTPHYGLYLSFLKLFKTAQDALNNYSKKHLDFYYKEVLQLQNKPPLPDTAHLTFELQQNIPQALLVKDTLFKGGKDSIGKDITYRLVDDVVLNKATVVSIAAQHIDLKKATPLKAFPIAASEDGEGAKLTLADGSWNTFGNPKKTITARAGFAIASNILYLNEGSRTITLTVQFDHAITELQAGSTMNIDCFDAELTGKKELVKKGVSTTYNEAQQQLIFTILLSPNDPAIIPYSETLHKHHFDTNLPLVIIYLNQAANGAIPYAVLCKQTITEVTVSVDVKGVKDLMLSSDVGTIDAATPFKPFGEFPAVGSAFYIGSKEMFQKKLSTLSLHFTGDNPFQPSTFFLDEGKWKPFANLSGNTISGINVEPAAIDFLPNENLSVTTLNGFVKLLNKTNKSLDEYFGRLQTSVNQTKLNRISTKPVKYELEVAKTPLPGDITISDFLIDYKAAATINFTAEPTVTDNHLFYHVTPFGYAQIAKNNSLANGNAEKIETYTLLHDVRNNGELYIGLTDAEPDSVITLLFGVADGSSNPLKEAEKLSWYYLSGNVWVQFQSRFIVDRTRHFTQSGVVTLTLPADISNQNTLFQKGMYWIKAAVKNNIDAVCNMILIQAQSAAVELLQEESNSIEFRNNVPAKTISKLVVSNAAVKTIAQPFDGFGGKTRETDDHFYVRVSERLRHKQRAISIWDYEHILLEQFPQLYKVKCLNHSGFYKENDTDVFCENYPGHVTLISIPDISQNTHANHLRPYTPIGLLSNMDAYLHTLISPFVKLHVKNPQFEEVQLEFEVTFYDGFDVGYYTQLLNTEIEHYLCPWAFNKELDIPFGASLVKSVLLNFVEERPYVDYLSCFRMHHLLRDGETVVFRKADVEVAVASTSRSILVSYYNETTHQRHLITSPATCNC